MMEKKDFSLKKIYEMVLLILPFILFAFSGFLKINQEEFGAAIAYVKLTDVHLFISYIIILFISISLFFKGYKKEWFFTWFGFFLYFIWFFLFPQPTIHGSMYNDFFWFFVPNDVADLEYFWIIPYTKRLLIVFIASILLFWIMIMLKVKEDKIFILIFTYFFSYCCLASFYYYFASIFQVQGNNLLAATKTFLIFNSISAIGFLIIIKYYKKNSTKLLIFILFLVANFFALNFFQITHGIQSYVFPDEANLLDRLMELIKFYLKYFILMSNLLYFFVFFNIILMVKKIRKRETISVEK